VLGGWLTDNYSWRWVFYINIPVGIASIVMTKLFIFDPPYLRPSRGDRLLGHRDARGRHRRAAVVLDKGRRTTGSRRRDHRAGDPRGGDCWSLS
jgi:DHA2 family multidrug resistance protein